MLIRWPVVFGVAVLVALAATVLVRRVALATGFVDRPGPTKSHSAETPYLGGLAIAGATLAGWVLEPGLSSRIAVVALAGTGVALLGLVDDGGGLGPWIRLAGEGAAAAAVVAAGVRAEPTHLMLLDVAITMLWIVGVTNALNLLDNMDGLAAGTAAAIAAGVFVLAAMNDQDALATAAAALAGACVGFLVLNLPPASIFMGDAGSLFLGFVLSIAVLEIRPELSPPGSLAVPVLLLALPVLDTAVVTLARFRHGRAVISGGKDHLSHRLVRLGLSPHIAVAVLVSTAVGTSALAVLAGSETVGLWITLGLAAVMLGALATIAGRVDVYGEAPIGFRARRRREARSAVSGVAFRPQVVNVPIRSDVRDSS